MRFFVSLQTGKRWLPSHSIAVPTPPLQISTSVLTDTNYPPFPSPLVLSLLLMTLFIICPKIPETFLHLSPERFVTTKAIMSFC